MLDWALRHRRKSLALAAAFLAASLALAPLLPSGFMPVSDLSLSRVDVFFPPGTPLSQTDGKLDEMAARLRQRPEVRAVFTTAGGEDASGATDVANGQLLIRLVPADQRELSQKAFEHAVRPLLDAFPTRAMPSAATARRATCRSSWPARMPTPCRGPRMRWNATCARCRASPTCRSRNRCRAPNC